MGSTPRTPGSAYTPNTESRKSGMSLGTPKTTSLNERLNTDYVNVGGDDASVDATLTRAITGCVGTCVTPRHLLVLLRILKAITFCFLVLNLAADLMYIVFLEITADKEVMDLAGGRRDLIIRVYGLFLSGIAICIELDYSVVLKAFYGFKGFIPRGLLLFFVSAITGARPIHANQVQAGDDDAADDAYAQYNVELDIPQSAIVFQMVTSFVV